MRVELPFGTRPYPLELGGREVQVLRAAELAPAPPLPPLIARALDSPTGAPLAAGRGARITVIVSDPTRNEPRAAFLGALRERLSDVAWTIAVATGTHGPCRVDELDIPDALLRGATIINHDGHRPEGLVELGVTSRGTPIRIHRCLVESDLVIATGCIRPHYFAGFGAGAKALFPGLGEAAAIRVNHRLKTEPGARAGVVVGNPCRDDLEEAVRKIATRTFLLNGVCGPDDGIHAAVSGDIVEAFRAGAALARPWFEVHAQPAPLVVASDGRPVAASLYQSAKIAAAAAPWVAPGGTLVLAAECRDGIGPLETVNEAIFRTGVLPRLPAGARLILVSGLSEPQTRRTLLAYAPSIESVVARTPGRILVLPRASLLLPELSS